MNEQLPLWYRLAVNPLKLDWTLKLTIIEILVFVAYNVALIYKADETEARTQNCNLNFNGFCQNFDCFCIKHVFFQITAVSYHMTTKLHLFVFVSI